MSVEHPAWGRTSVVFGMGIVFVLLIPGSGDACDPERLERLLLSGEDPQWQWSRVRSEQQRCARNLETVRILGRYWFRRALSSEEPPLPPFPTRVVTKIKSGVKTVPIEEEVITEEMLTGLIIPDEVRKRYPNLLRLIVLSESMNLEERNYWLQVLPVMTPDQVEELRDILVTERRKLSAIDAKYAKDEKVTLGTVVTAVPSDLRELPTVRSHRVCSLRAGETLEVLPATRFSGWLEVSHPRCARPGLVAARDVEAEEPEVLIPTLLAHGAGRAVIDLYRDVSIPEVDPAPGGTATERDDVAWVRWLLGRLGLEVGEDDEAASPVVPSMGQDPRAEMSTRDLMRLGEAYLLAGKPDAAVQVLQGAAARLGVGAQDPSEAALRRLLALAAAWTGEFAWSLESHEAVDPTQLGPEARWTNEYRHGIYLVLNGHSRRAFTELEPYLHRDPEYGRELDLFFCRVASLQAALGFSQEAAARARQAVLAAARWSYPSPWWEQAILGVTAGEDLSLLIPPELHPADADLGAKTLWAGGVSAMGWNNLHALKMLERAVSSASAEGSAQRAPEVLLAHEALRRLPAGEPILVSDGSCSQRFRSCHAVLVSAPGRWSPGATRLAEGMAAHGFEVIQRADWPTRFREDEFLEFLSGTVRLETTSRLPDLFLIYLAGSTLLSRDLRDVRIILGAESGRDLPGVMIRKLSVDLDDVVAGLERHGGNRRFVVVVEGAEAATVSRAGGDAVTRRGGEGTSIVVASVGAGDRILDCLRRHRSSDPGLLPELCLGLEPERRSERSR